MGITMTIIIVFSTFVRILMCCLRKMWTKATFVVTFCPKMCANIGWQVLNVFRFDYNVSENKMGELLLNVRQGDTLSPKLYTSALEDVFKLLDWNRRDIAIDGDYMSHLRFADDIVIVTKSPQELQEMLISLNDTFQRVGLVMNLDKTKVETTTLTANVLAAYKVRGVEIILRHSLTGNLQNDRRTNDDSDEDNIILQAIK